jgi:hypothetical protein
MNLASAFIYGKDAVLDSLTPVEVDNYLTALKTEMGSTADQQEVDFYQTAIDRLQDLKARHNTK